MADLTDDELLAELGVDVEQPKTRTYTAREERVIAGFEDIVRFYEEHGRAPLHGEERDIFERLYAVRLDRLRELDEFRVLLAGMDKVTAGVGEFLRAGEPVGEMGSGPASVTLFGEVVPDGRPVLYIEFRDGTEAIDSGPWWIGGLKEASG